MSISALRRAASGTLVVALLLGVLASVLAARPAQARVATIAFSFDQLMPGEARSGSDTFTIPRESRLVDVEVTEESSGPGSFAWELSLCPASGACLPVTPQSEGRSLSAGEARLEVTVTLDEEAEQLASSTISGRLVLTEDDDGEDGGLPPTGAAVVGLVASALGLLGLGAGFLVVARRRSSSRPTLGEPR